MPQPIVPRDCPSLPDGDLATLQQAIRSCTRCAEAGYLEVANPIVHGRAGTRNMVIGQAPGVRVDAEGRSWVGTSGATLRRWFARAGFDPERFDDDWYFTAMTRCFPGRARTGSGDRAPSARERALCRPNLDAELALIRPTLIITLGRLAAEAFVPGAREMRLHDLVGTLHEVAFPWGPVLIVPLPHPSGVGRWLNDPANRTLVDTAMDALSARLALP